MHAQVRLAFKAQGGHRGERTVILPIFAPLHAGSRLATRLPAGLPTPVHLQIGPPLGAGAVPQPSAARSPLGLDLLTSLAPPPTVRAVGSSSTGRQLLWEHRWTGEDPQLALALGVLAVPPDRDVVTLRDQLVEGLDARWPEPLDALLDPRAAGKRLRSLLTQLLRRSGSRVTDVRTLRFTSSDLESGEVRVREQVRLAYRGVGVLAGTVVGSTGVRGRPTVLVARGQVRVLASTRSGRVLDIHTRGDRQQVALRAISDVHRIVAAHRRAVRASEAARPQAATSTAATAATAATARPTVRRISTVNLRRTVPKASILRRSAARLAGPRVAVARKPPTRPEPLPDPDQLEAIARKLGLPRPSSRPTAGPRADGQVAWIAYRGIDGQLHLLTRERGRWRGERIDAADQPPALGDLTLSVLDGDDLAVHFCTPDGELCEVRRTSGRWSARLLPLLPTA